MNRTFLKGAALVLVAALVLAACNKGGSGGSAGGSNRKAAPVSDFDYRFNEEGVTITGYKGKGGVVVIPSTIDDMPVVYIGNTAFIGGEENPSNKITEIVIPDSVERIGYSAFAKLKNLTTANLPASIKQVHYNAFANCSELNNLIIPDSLTSVLFMDRHDEAKGDSTCFEGCGKLPIATRQRIKDLGYKGNNI